MSEQRKKLKTWQGWAIFGGAMVFVFCLGLLAASITNRRAEITTIYANKKDKIAQGEAKNPMYQGNYPREYETWTQTADTSFRSEFNGSQAVDVLEQRPNMVIFWAGYAFSRDYTSPRGHMHAIEDVTRTLRTGNPGIDGDGDIQPATCSCRGICTTRSRYNQGYSPRDAFAGMCTVPRRILLQRRRQISDIPLGQGLHYGRRRALLRRSRLLRLYT